jgi:hypothetical protein
VAFERRDAKRQARYSFENRPTRFAPALAARFKGSPDAWRFFSAQPQGYRRTVIFWVMSAVREETRERRLARLIEVSQAGSRLDMLTPNRPSRPRLARGAPND